MRSGTWNPETHTNVSAIALAKAEASSDARTMIKRLRSRMAYKDLAQGFNPEMGVFDAICRVGGPGTPFEGWRWKHAQSRGKQTWRPFRPCRVNCGNPGLSPVSPSGKRKSAAKHRTPNTKRQTPNAKHLTPNTERPTPDVPPQPQNPPSP